MRQTFRIAITGDFYSDGLPTYPAFDLSMLDAARGIEYFAFDRHLPEIAPRQLAGTQAAIVLSPRVTRDSLSKSDDLLAVARFGVGYDTVDVAACTEADVVLLVARGAVDRPVAEATLGWMIALSHHFRVKDALVREGRWNERVHFMGTELRERTLGLIGFGGIARELVRLLSCFGMKLHLVYDPFVEDDAITSLGAVKTELDELLKESDYVSLHCPLTESTRQLIGRRELSLMKPTAYLINTARGGIIDEPALVEALSERRIAGAALDCFVEEPLPHPHPLSPLDNVLLAPHAIAWTNELFGDIGRMCCQGLIDLANGRRPHGVVNTEVFERPSFQEKWSRLVLSAS